MSRLVCTWRPLKKMGYAGLIIALQRHGVRVKGEEEHKQLCKRWCLMNNRPTLGFICKRPCVMSI